MRQRFSLVQSKITQRIFLLFVLCALLPVCALAAITIWQMSAKVQEQSVAALRRQCKDAGMTIIESLALLQTELHAAARAASNGEQPAPLHNMHCPWARSQASPT